MTERVGQYEITAMLGRGAQGVTYRGSGSDGSEVAVKLYPASDRQMAEQEAHLLQSVEHRGIPRLIDLIECEHEGEPHVAVIQEFVEGRSLQELIDSEIFLSEEQIKDLARQLLAIAAYLHSREPPLLHRDIKPANIIFGSDGRLWLVDFGGGLAVQETGEVIGTAGYSAPEQYFDQAGPRSDLYSLGATLLAITTRRHPSDFPVRNMRYDLDGRLSCGDELQRLIEALLEPDVSRRPSSADEAATLLEAPADTSTKRVSITRTPDGLDIEIGRSFRGLLVKLVINAMVATLLASPLAFEEPEAFATLAGLLFVAVLPVIFVLEFPHLRTERLQLSRGEWTLTRSLGLSIERSGTLAPGFDLRRGSRWNHLLTYDGMVATRFGAGTSARSVERIRAAIRSFVDQRNDDVVLDLKDHDDAADDATESTEERASVTAAAGGG